MIDPWDRNHSEKWSGLARREGQSSTRDAVLYCLVVWNHYFL